MVTPQSLHVLVLGLLHLRLQIRIIAHNMILVNIIGILVLVLSGSLQLGIEWLELHSVHDGLLIVKDVVSLPVGHIVLLVDGHVHTKHLLNSTPHHERFL